MSANRLLILVNFLISTAIVNGMEYEYEIVESLRGRIAGLSLEKKSLTEPLNLTVKPYGFVQLEFHADSRQVLGLGLNDSSATSFGPAGDAGEPISAWYPERIVYDVQGNDINAHPQAHLTPQRSTFGLLIGGPDFTEASILAAIEGDFCTSNFDAMGETSNNAQTFFGITSMRLRHAFIYCSWNDWGLLIGQYWHPLIISQCWPETVDPVTAVPIEFDATAPQIELIKAIGPTNIILTLASQRNYESPGPIENPFFTSSSAYIRDAFIPNINLKITADLEWLFFGASFDYKRLRPLLASSQEDNAVAQNTYVNSFIGEAFCRFDFDSTIVRFKGAYVENGSDQGALSGYAIETIDPITNFRTYANTACWNVWGDCMHYLDSCREHQLGIFGGITKNCGSNKELMVDPSVGTFNIYTLPTESASVDYVLKLFPRYVFNRAPFVIGVEVAFSRAAWGTPNEFAKIAGAVPVNNVRFTFQFNYVF